MSDLNKIDQIMESEEVKTILSENEELIAEATESTHNFSKIMKAFVINNPSEFIGENLEETFKNIRVFSEVATAQYLTEISDIAGDNLVVQEPVVEASINDYL